MSDAYDATRFTDDDQAVAEELDDDRFDGDKADYPPDHALASLEATTRIDNGDVPRDTLEERRWREQPDDLPAPDDSIRLIEPDPDAGHDAAFADLSAFAPGDDVGDGSELLGQATDPDSVPAAEEAAEHIIED